MAAGAGGGRSMEESATWAVALVCLVIISLSLGLEQIIHIIGKVRIHLPFVYLIHVMACPDITECVHGNL